MYQQVNLSDRTLVGAPGTVPDNLVGLSDVVLADISAAIQPPPPGLAGQGFWPVTVTTPNYDAAKQVLDGSYTYVLDPAAKTVTGTADLRDLTSAELASALAATRSAKSALVDDQRDTIIAGGFTHDFGGTIGVKTLQTRDSVDITNWLTSQAAYSAAVMGGHGAIMAASFRATDNTTFTLSYQDGLAALLAMAAHGAALYANAWGLKDKIAAAADQAALDAIDITTSWAALT